MTRVLFVAYHFPPVGGAGVQRTVKFLRYLPSFGVDADVLTGPLGSVGDRHLTDDTLSLELPPDLVVHRARGPEPRPSIGWRGRGERWLRLRSPWTRWWQEKAPEAVAAGSEIDVVFATMSPFQSAEVAATIARRRGVPWVADLRDPWALDEMIAYPTGLHRRLEQRRMRRALGTAAAVVMNTPEASRQLVESFPELASRRVVCIPNGYDAADFEGAAPERADEGFRIVHVGSLHTEQGEEHRRTMGLRKALGGTLGEVDILPRSHVYLMEALDRLVAEEPGLAQVVELHLGGDLSDADRNAIRSPLVHTPGYLAHADSVALVRSADLLFLPMHDLPGGRRARIVPGKTYEYLASGRPILGAVPAGDASDLLNEARAGHVCAPTDVDCMVRAIRAELERKRRGEPVPPPDPELLRRYERRELAGRLAELLHEVAGAAAPSVVSAGRES